MALPAWLLYGTFTFEVDEKLANRKFEEALSLMALSSIGSKLETDSSDILTAYLELSLGDLVEEILRQKGALAEAQSTLLQCFATLQNSVLYNLSEATKDRIRILSTLCKPTQNAGKPLATALVQAANLKVGKDKLWVGVFVHEGGKELIESIKDVQAASAKEGSYVSNLETAMAKTESIHAGQKVASPDWVHSFNLVTTHTKVLVDTIKELAAVDNPALLAEHAPSVKNALAMACNTLFAVDGELLSKP